MTISNSADNNPRTDSDHYCELLDDILFPVVLSSVQNNLCLYMNQRAIDLFEIHDKNIYEISITEYYVEPDNRKELIDRLKAKGSVSNYEVLLKTGTGRILHALISSTLTIFHNELAVCSVFNDVTDRKLVESKLSNAHRRLDQIIDFLPDATFVINRKGKVIAWNKAIEEMTGVARKEIIGKGDQEYALPFYGEKRMLLSDLILLPDNDKELQKYNAVQNSGNVIYGETYVPKAYGNRGAYLWVTASLLRDSEGNIIGAIESLRDITERRRTEKLLKDSESKYRNIFKNATEGIFQSTLDGKYISLNPAFARIRGYESPEELLNMKGDVQKQAYVHPEDRLKLIKLLEKQGFVNNYEVEAWRKDGSIIWVSMNVRPIRDENGNISLLEGTIQDITERKKAEEELRESEERFRKLFENHTAIKLLIDAADGKIIDANQAASDYYGWSRKELQQMKIQNINTLPPEEVNRAIKSVQSGKRARFEFQHRRADGSIRDVEVLSSRVDIKGRECLHSIINDITERKHLEEELLRSQKLESLGILAGGIAHDFNNLMTMVHGYIELSLLDLPDDHPSHTNLQAAIKSVERTKDLTSKLITFSLGGDPNKEISDMAGIIRSAVTERTQGTNIGTEFDFAEKLHPVKIDELQMKQVFFNLTANAMEAMPEGGLLKVKAENSILAAKDIPDLEGGSYLKITFTDEGIGIPEENLSKIFDPYFTTKKMAARKGLGLGLAVCYSVLKKHGGHIAVNSQPGKGTSFILHIPAQSG